MEQNQTYIEEKKKIANSVNWVRAILIVCIVNFVLSFTLTIVEMTSVQWLVFLFASPFKIFIDLVNNKISTSYPIYVVILVLSAFYFIVLVLNLVTRIISTIKVYKTDYLDDDFNNARKTYAILLLLVPLIMAIVFLSKIKSLDFDPKNYVTTNLQIQKNKSTYSKRVVEKQLKKVNNNIVLNIVFYVVLGADIVFGTFLGNNGNIGWILVLLFMVTYLFTIAMIVVWIVNLIVDSHKDYGIELLDKAKVKNSWLTFFFRLTGYNIWKKKLLAFLEENNSVSKPSTLKIVQEWNDENNTHWGMDADGKYYWKCGDEWIAY